MQQTSPEEIEARLERLCADGARHIVGLTGPPGTGKSTLAERLIARLPGRAIIVPMDGFHLANSELRRLGRSDRKGAADTFDSAGYVALLKRLRNAPMDEVIYAPEFRRDLEEAIAGAIPVLPEHRLIITEGNYLLLDTGHWAGIRALIDEIWYLDLDPAVRMERLITRHIRFGRDEPTARAWVAQTDVPNAVLIESTRARADAVISLDGAGSER